MNPDVEIYENSRNEPKKLFRINKSSLHLDARGARAKGVLLALTLAALSDLAMATKPTVKSVGEALVCQCGVCNFPVSTCNHEVCSSRDEMQAMAAKEIAAGKDETTILQDFVLRYGVKVLATPPASGFNLSVWVLPGLGLIVGLVVVIAVARRWRKPPAPPGPGGTTVDPATLAAVEEEMKELGP